MTEINMANEIAVPEPYRADRIEFLSKNGIKKPYAFQLERTDDGNTWYVGILSNDGLELVFGMVCEYTDLHIYIDDYTADVRVVASAKIPHGIARFSSHEARIDWLDRVQWRESSGVLFATGLKPSSAIDRGGDRTCA